MKKIIAIVFLLYGFTTKGQFIECPVVQNTVKNGSKPDAELFKKIIRCKKAKSSVPANDEGAVLVEIANMQIGSPRPWSCKQDIGSGSTNTIVYPVKATFSVKTLYRKATEVEEGWGRILNFYVNSFGEWQIGSEEPIQSPKVRRIRNKRQFMLKLTGFGNLLALIIKHF